MNGNNEINWKTAKKGWQSVGQETSTLTDAYTKIVKMKHFLRLRRVGKIALSRGDGITFLVKKKKQHAGVVRIFTGQCSPNKWAANHYYVLAGIIERLKLTFQVVLFDSCEFHKARYFEGSENLKLLKDAWDVDGPRAIIDYFQDDFDSSFTEKASGPRKKRPRNQPSLFAPPLQPAKKKEKKTNSTKPSKTSRLPRGAGRGGTPLPPTTPSEDPLKKGNEAPPSAQNVGMDQLSNSVAAKVMDMMNSKLSAIKSPPTAASNDRAGETDREELNKQLQKKLDDIQAERINEYKTTIAQNQLQSQNLFSQMAAFNLFQNIQTANAFALITNKSNQDQQTNPQALFGKSTELSAAITSLMKHPTPFSGADGMSK